jgi:hypothetical protein
MSKTSAPKGQLNAPRYARTKLPRSTATRNRTTAAPIATTPTQVAVFGVVLAETRMAAMTISGR